MFNTHNSYYANFGLLTNKNYSMKIYCLSTSTVQSVWLQFLGRRFVVKLSAIDDYINETKDRFLAILPDNPELWFTSVYVNVVIRSNDSTGVLVPVKSFHYVISINEDYSFNVKRD